MDVTRHVLADPAMFLIKCNFDVERFNCWNTQADVPSSFSYSPSFFSINELRIWHSSLALLREGNPLTRATERTTPAIRSPSDPCANSINSACFPCPLAWHLPSFPQQHAHPFCKHRDKGLRAHTHVVPTGSALIEGQISGPHPPFEILGPGNRCFY